MEKAGITTGVLIKWTLGVKFQMFTSVINLLLLLKKIIPLKD
jgi:hypothetical protein